MSMIITARDRLRINRPSPIHSYDNLRSSLKIPRAWRDPHLPLDLSKLPTIPTINYPHLKKQVVTHQTVFTSTLGRDPFLMHERINTLSYEPLEMLGDRYMGACAVLALRRHFPDLSASRIVELTTTLLSNRTISYISYGYGLHRDLKLGDNFPQDGDNYNQKVCADLFEARIGALLVEADKNGSEREIRDWLAEVFSSEVFPTLNEIVESWNDDLKQSLSVSRRTKRKALNQHPSLCLHCSDSNAKRVSIEYKEIQPRHWHARVVRGGVEVGCGSGSTKSEAHDVAISNAMEKALEGRSV